MEAKNVISYEFEKEDRVYRLMIPHGAPIGEAYEAAASFLDEMVRMINEHADQVRPKGLEEAAPVDQELEEEV